MGQGPPGQSQVQKGVWHGKSSLIYAALEVSGDTRAPDPKTRCALSIRLPQRMYTKKWGDTTDGDGVAKASGLSALAVTLQNGQGRECMWHILVVELWRERRRRPAPAQRIYRKSQEVQVKAELV